MEFIKKHYEKVLLGVVLLGLAVAAASLPLMVQGEKDRLAQKRDEIINRPIKPLPPVDLGAHQAVFGKIKSPQPLDLSRPHNLFNPVPWKKTPDGRVIPERTGKEFGPEAVAITQITNLYTVITLDSVSGGYLVGVEKQAAARPQDRRKRQAIARPNEKSESFTLREVKGAAEDPELVLELADTGMTVTISREKPYMRVDGYMADLKYEPEKKNFANQRVGSSMVVGGEKYNIVAIDSNAVVLSAPNEKKTTIRKDGSP